MKQKHKKQVIIKVPKKSRKPAQELLNSQASDQPQRKK